MPASEARSGPTTGLVFPALHHTAPQRQGVTPGQSPVKLLFATPQAAAMAAEVNLRNSSAWWSDERMC